MAKKKTFRGLTLKRALILFLALSLGLHLLFVAGGVASEKIAQMRQRQLAQRQRQDALARQEKLKKAKQELARLALSQTREQVKAELKREFNTVVADSLKPNASDQLWDAVLAQLESQLDTLSQSVGDEQLTDAQVQEQMQQIQSQMLDEMLKEVCAMGARKLGESYVERVKTEVAPLVANYYRRQIDQKIGTPLRVAGTKIINEDAQDVRSERQTTGQTLVKAENQVKAAQAELTQAGQHLAQQSKAAPGDPQKAAAATKNEQPAIAHAASAITAAQKELQEAAGKPLAEGRQQKALQTAASSPAAKAALAQAGAAGTAAASGKHADAATQATSAAQQAGKFLEAIHSARIAKDNPDTGAVAREGVKDVRDEAIKGQLDQSFHEKVAGKAVPRIAQQLTDSFSKTLDQAGIRDDAVVRDVQKKIEAALGETVRGDVKAGDTGTGQLTKAGRLDEVGRKNGNAGGGRAEQGPAGEAGGSPDAHVTAVADKMKKAAQDITAGGMEGIAADGGADKLAAQAAAKGAAGGAAGGGAGGDSELAQRIARLSGMLQDGQGDLAGAGGNAPGPGAGAGGMGGAGGSWGGLAGLRQSAFGRSRATLLIRNDDYGFDLKKYQEMTAAMHARDMNAARGSAIALQGATGDATDITSIAAAARDQPQPAAVVVPREDPARTPVGIAEAKDPYKPAFENIRFAAIPYRTKPIVVDGDLAEWADVPAIPMTAIVPSAKDPTAAAIPLQIKLQWDNTGFYVAYDVKKADPKITKVHSADFWEGDAVEFFIDTLNTKEKERNLYTQQFWAWPDGAIDDPRIIGGEAVHLGRREERNGFGADLLQVASKKTAAGWTMEFHVPRERLHKVDMEPGRIMGMNFSIFTGGGPAYYWAGSAKTGTWASPDTWGDVLLAGSDVRVEVVDKLASELRQTETAKPQAYQKIGEPLRIRVTDPVMNLSGSRADKIAASVASRHGGRQEVILEETGNSTGIFEGAIATALETGDPVPSGLALYDGETLDITYNDQCRPNGARNVKVTLSLPTAAAISRASSK